MKNCVKEFGFFVICKKYIRKIWEKLLDTATETGIDAERLL